MIRTGGLGAIKEKDSDVVEVVNKIKPLLEQKTGKKYSSLEVINYKTQVVAGTNFFVKVSTFMIVHVILFYSVKVKTTNRHMLWLNSLG